ncbi:DUF1289 domain-containing protein [Accumulibacter sp.]|nr:DUF1289 domain-containing protein [Accumulibacter sp.]MCM8634532.1 DUF1289 domain-containing protein [Accumulibacter sp.]
MGEAADDYLCVGICMPDPDSGYCLGCGRPPLPVSTASEGIVVVEERRSRRVPDESPDSECPAKR